MSNDLKYVAGSEVAEVKVTAKPVCYSASGHGRKIPTQYMIRIGARWYRVYCACFSNMGSVYIVRNREWEFCTRIEHLLEDARDAHRVRYPQVVAV